MTRRHTLKNNQCTNFFCLQIKGENVRIKVRELKHPYEAQGIPLNKCRFPLYFILTASNAILSGGYLLPHCISVSIQHLYQMADARQMTKNKT